MVSTMPSEVIGLTNHEAPSTAVVPSGSTMHCAVGTQRYCEYIAPPIIDTVFPIMACAAGDEPAATTTPAPSLPTGSDSSNRAASIGITSRTIFAVTTGRSGVPPMRAVAGSGRQQQADIRRVERRRLDAHEHLVGP